MPTKKRFPRRRDREGVGKTAAIIPIARLTVYEPRLNKSANRRMNAIFAHADNLCQFPARKRSRLAVLLFVARDKTQDRNRNYGNVVPARTAMACHRTASFIEVAPSAASWANTTSPSHASTTNLATHANDNLRKLMSRIIGDPSPHRQLKKREHPLLTRERCQARWQATKWQIAPFAPSSLSKLPHDPSASIAKR